MSYWEPDYFNITAVTLPAWTLLDFCLGVLAGAAIRRTAPAMAAVLAAAVIAAILGTGFAVTQYHTATERLFGLAAIPARSLPLLSPRSGGRGRTGAGR
jgi:hypothetical protein